MGYGATGTADNCFRRTEQLFPHPLNLSVSCPRFLWREKSGADTVPFNAPLPVSVGSNPTLAGCASNLPFSMCPLPTADSEHALPELKHGLPNTHPSTRL